MKVEVLVRIGVVQMQAACFKGLKLSANLGCELFANRRHVAKPEAVPNHSVGREIA